jgi:protein SCO1/2
MQRAEGAMRFLIAAVLLFSAVSCGADALPARPGPEWTLTNQQNQPFGSANLKGKVSLVTFVYTHCPTVCPLLTAQMKQLQDELKQDRATAERVTFVSITVDPQRDTPARLKEYAAQMGVDFATWSWVTGESAELQRTWKSFGVVAYVDLASMSGEGVSSANSAHGAHSATASDASHYEVNHTVKVVLLDARGNIRAEYIGQQLPLTRVTQDIHRLLNESE